ncbi:MAG: energy-coupling factor transporter ATPase [Acidaminococcales bacterium]|jgi:energy-coupling factor transport system ATP-binding protein|nr:energy-coupling factor transporter ATPase [Acidaminococcales bacterium]
MPLSLENVSYVYMKGTPYERRAVDNVSLEIQKGEFVALIGHSGSGKSTLAQHMAGLLPPLAGQVKIDGTDPCAKGKEALTARRKAGLVFQYPEHQLFAETVFDDVAFGPRNLGLAEEEVRERAATALDFAQMPIEEFGARSPFQLSGGQMRKAAIAGVIAMRPDYLILDEPTAGFDPLARGLFYEELKNLHKKSGMAVIMITHSMEEAIELARRLLVMSGGRIIIDGQPERIFREQRGELLAAGVTAPAIVSLTDRLRAHGFSINADCLDADDLVAELLAVLPGKGPGDAR